MKPNDIHEGDLVSVDKWDCTVPPDRRIGSPATVLRCTPWRRFESGCCVTIRGTSGLEEVIDAHWLEPWRAQEATP